VNKTDADDLVSATIFRVERVQKKLKITTKVEKQELNKFGPGACALRRKLHSIIWSTFPMNSNMKLFLFGYTPF
jgi:hypothetical protein